MLPKAHLTLHSRMSGSRWAITPSWLSGLWRSFLYSSSVYSYHLFLISSVSVRSISFLSFIVPVFSWKFPLVSLIFLNSFLVFPFCCFPLLLCIEQWKQWQTLFSWAAKSLQMLTAAMKVKYWPEDSLYVLIYTISSLSTYLWWRLPLLPYLGYCK